MNAQQSFRYGALFAEVSGLVMVVLALVPGGLAPGFDLIFLDDGMVLGPPARFASGVAGAVLAGWGASMALIARELHRLEAHHVGTAFGTGVLLWFVLDGLVSIALGAYANLIGNTLYFVVLFLPAWALRRRAVRSEKA